MQIKALHDVPPTQLLSPHGHHTFPTSFCCSNTWSLDLTCLLACACFPPCSSLAFSTLSPSMLLHPPKMSPNIVSTGKSFLTSAPHPVPSALAHDLYKCLRVFVSSALSYSGSWCPCKQGLGFSAVLVQYLAYVHNLQWIAHTQKCTQQSYS